MDSPEAKAAVLGFLKSPPSSSPPHNKSSNNSNLLADVVSQGTQTGSAPSTPTDTPEQQVGERQEGMDMTTLPTTWLGPGPNGGN